MWMKAAASHVIAFVVMWFSRRAVKMIERDTRQHKLKAKSGPLKWNLWKNNVCLWKKELSLLTPWPVIPAMVCHLHASSNLGE